ATSLFARSGERTRTGAGIAQIFFWRADAASPYSDGLWRRAAGTRKGNRRAGRGVGGRGLIGIRNTLETARERRISRRHGSVVRHVLEGAGAGFARARPSFSEAGVAACEANKQLNSNEARWI